MDRTGSRDRAGEKNLLEDKVVCQGQRAVDGVAKQKPGWRQSSHLSHMLKTEIIYRTKQTLGRLAKGVRA